ncbi:MAG: hypothetical protein R2716_04010 [Microthrixaceae bacterium]
MSELDTDAARAAGGSGSGPRLSGTARVGRRTKDLAKRLRGGEIAFIDHRDLDRVAGESLVATGVAAVVNASESISGRYPNSGPARLVEAGIVVVDAAGPEIMDLVEDGATVAIEGGRILVEGREVAAGEVLDATAVHDRMEAARLHRCGAAQLRRQHPGVHRQGGRLRLRAARGAGASHAVPGTPRAGGRARTRLQGGPEGPASLHRGAPAPAGRGRRGCRRTPRGRLQAGHDHR